MAMRIVLVALGVAAVACRPQPSTTSVGTSSTATSIAPEPIAAPKLAVGTALVVAPGATVWLDRGDARALMLPDTLAEGALAVRVIGNAGDRVEVEIDTDAPCMAAPLRDLRLRFFALSSALREPPKQCSDVAGEAPTSEQQATRIVRGGTEVFWRDGEPAGTVARDSTFAAPPAVAGARTCFPFALAPGDEITLCFAAQAIAEVRTPDVQMPTNSLSGRDDSSGLIGLGSSGDADFGGLGGLGPRRGAAGLGSASSSSAMVRPAKPDVVGPLDKDIVRRIVRAHLNELRFCYGKALVRNPETSGKVTIGFTIDHEGSVVEALPKTSTVADDELVTCMTARVTRWKFPKPSGAGTVKVTYPFLLAPK